MLDNEIFDWGGTLIENADTALYGRKTWQIMEAYWPGAADKPGASKHDKDHSAWYKKVDKIVLSRTLVGKNTGKTRFIGNNIGDEIIRLKEMPGKNIQIFGSPSVVRILSGMNLIDEYWLYLNPLILGNGIRLFETSDRKSVLKLAAVKQFACGVAALHYTV